MDLNLYPNIWIWILKKIIQISFVEKMDLVQNMIQLFGSKMDMDWIFKNPIHDHPLTYIYIYI